MLSEAVAMVTPTLQVEVCRWQRHDADIKGEHALGDALEILSGQGTQHGDMAEHRAPLHAEALDPFEGGVQQMHVGLEVFVEMQVNRLSGLYGGGKQHVEVTRRIFGDGGRAAHDIGQRHRAVDVFCQPVEILAGMRRHEGDELKGDAVSFCVTDTGQRLDAVEAGILVDVDMAADGRGAAGQTSLDGARGALVDVVRTGGAGIFGKGLASALQRAGRVGRETEHAGLVEVLVCIEEAWGNQHAGDVHAGAAGAGVEVGLDGDDAPIRSHDDVADRLRAVVMNDGSARKRKGLAGCQICKRRSLSVTYHSSPPSCYAEKQSMGN
jgi:hypothetical protein